MYPFVVKISSYYDEKEETKYYLTYGNSYAEVCHTMCTEYYHEDEIISIELFCVGDNGDFFQVTEELAKAFITGYGDLT